jgi:hypothetical protein
LYNHLSLFEGSDIAVSQIRVVNPRMNRKQFHNVPEMALKVRNYYYSYSALGPVRAETIAQSGDWYGSGTLHPGQILRGSLPLLSPAFRRSNFRHQVPHVRHDAKDPSGGRWNCGREYCPVILPK